MAEKLFVYDTEMIQVADAIREMAGTTDALSFPEGFIENIQIIYDNSNNNSGNLNFTIVNGTNEPSNVAENTVWVKSNIAIPGWSFSYSRPNVTTHGYVWFQLADADESGFNALSENNITLNPIVVQQYNSSAGAWQTKQFAVYINGAWRESTVGVFTANDEHTGLTGGWQTVAYNPDKSYWYQYKGFTKTATSLSLRSGTENNYICTCGTKNLIDLTYFTTLQVKVTSYAKHASIIVSNTLTGPVGQWTVGSTGVINCNIANIKGAHRIMLHVYCESSSSASTLAVSEVKLLR